MSRSNKRRKTDRINNGLALILITIVAVCLAVVLGIKSVDDKARNEQLTEREEALDKQVQEQEDRAEQLEEQRIYVQTKQYVEEVAKEKLGLVYEDEILLKPEEK